jgi:hypothetical protein
LLLIDLRASMNAHRRTFFVAAAVRRMGISLAARKFGSGIPPYLESLAARFKFTTQTRSHIYFMLHSVAALSLVNAMRGEAIVDCQ